MSCDKQNFNLDSYVPSPHLTLSHLSLRHIYPWHRLPLCRSSGLRPGHLMHMVFKKIVIFDLAIVIIYDQAFLMSIV